MAEVTSLVVSGAVVSAAGDAVEGAALGVSVVLACDEVEASLWWWASVSSPASSPAVSSPASSSAVTPPSPPSASVSVDVPPEVVAAVEAGGIDVSKDVDVEGDVTGEEAVIPERGSSGVVEVGEADAAEVEFPLSVVVAPCSWATPKEKQQATSRNSAKYNSPVTLARHSKSENKRNGNSLSFLQSQLSGIKKA